MLSLPKFCLLSVLMLSSCFVFAKTSDAETATVKKLHKRLSISERLLTSYETDLEVLLHSSNAVERYSQMSFFYNPLYESYEILEAYTLSARGVKSELDSAAIQERNVAQERMFFDTKEVVLALPNVEVGAEIHFSYRVSEHLNPFTDYINKNVSVYWWEFADVQQLYVDPVEEFILDVSHPVNAQVNYNTPEMLPLNVDLRAAKDGFSVMARNLKPLKFESNIPGDYKNSTAIQINSFQSWQNVSNWYESEFAGGVSSSNNIAKIANELRVSHLNDYDLVRAVFDFVGRDIRYISAHLGKDGFTPKFADETLKLGYGDCKDQTALTISILQFLGFEAYPLLITTDQRSIDPKFPSSNFDHVIVAVNTDSGVLYLDNTSRGLAFPGISKALEGKPALAITANADIQSFDTGREVEERVEVVVENSFEDNELIYSVDIMLSGTLGQALKFTLATAANEKQILENMLSKAYPSKSVRNIQYVANNENDDLLISIDYVIDELTENAPVNLGENFTRALSVFLAFGELDSPNEREHEFVIQRPVKLKHSVIFNPPDDEADGYTSMYPVHVESPFFEIKFEKQSDENAIGERKYVFNFTVPAQRLSMDQYSVFYSDIQRLYKSLMLQITYSKKINSDKALEAVIAKVNAQEMKTISSYIELADAQLDAGEYKLAVETLLKGVNKHSDDPNVNYKLGLAYGYIHEYELSDEYFERALELGYEF